MSGKIRKKLNLLSPPITTNAHGLSYISTYAQRLHYMKKKQKKK